MLRKKYGSFVFGKFHYINILRFILYSTVLRNFLIFIVKFSLLPMIFSYKGFHVNSWCLSLFSYFIIMPLISTQVDCVCLIEASFWWVSI